MRRLAFAVCFVALVSPAVALAATPDRVAVSISGGTTDDASAVLAAVRRELSEVKVDAGASARLDVVLSGKTARLSYRDANGAVVQRDIDLPDDRARAAEAVALLAGNLVRDQTGDLEASLRPPPPPAPPPAPPPPVAPPAARSTAPPGPCANGSLHPAVAQAWPGLAAPPRSSDADARRGFTLAFVGGHPGAVKGLELSAIGSYGTRGVCGAQIGGVFTMTEGQVRGLQTAGVFAKASAVHGVALAPVTLAGDLRGLQIGAVAAARDVTGVQLGAVGVARDVDGVTVHAVGVARDHRGLAVSAVNVARRAKVQLGVVNFAEEADAPIGVVSIVTHGRTAVDAFSLDYGGAAVGLLHGGKYTHTSYAVGGRVTRDGQARPVLLLGLGAHVPWGRAYLGGDVSSHFLAGEGFKDNANVFQARAFIGVPLASKLSAYLGPTLSVSQAPTTADESFSRVGDERLGTVDGHVWRLWPGAAVGLRWTVAE